MYTQADKSQGTRNQLFVKGKPSTQSNSRSPFQFVDKREEAIAQSKLQEIVNNSPQVRQFKAFQKMADNNSQQSILSAHRKPLNSESIVLNQQPLQNKTNNTGLPDPLKSGIETLSGYSMDDVKVHYNSNKPAQFRALAYAQGTEIHIGPGQEKHLPHEAWHVVQQKQKRVHPTLQLKENVTINDDHELEKEADIMGAKAAQMTIAPDTGNGANVEKNAGKPLKTVSPGFPSIQMEASEELKEKIQAVLTSYPGKLKDARPAIKKIFEDAGVHKKVKTPFLARHTNNSQILPLPEHPTMGTTANLDDIIGISQELVESTSDLIDGYISDNPDTDDFNAFYYEEFNLIDAELHFTVFQAMQTLAKLTTTSDKRTEGLKLIKELLDYSKTVKMAIDTISSNLENEAEVRKNYNQNLSDLDKWKVSAATELKKDSFFGKDHADLAADFNARTLDDEQGADKALAKPHPLLSRSAAPDKHKEMFLNSLVDMVISGEM
jgi:hypothetical protein